MHVRDDFSPAIEPAANPDVQISTVGTLPSKRRQAVGFFRRRCKCKAGRSPGALPDAVRAGSIECRQHGGNCRTRKAPAALCEGEIAAKPHLQFLYGSAEARDVAFGECRQYLHEDQAAKVSGISLRHWRKTGKGRHLLGTVHAATQWIEDSQNAPITGKRQVADNRRHRWLAAMAAIDNEAAAVE